MRVQKVLLVSYSFFPEPAIGARRWSKFAGYLMEEGVEVVVATRRVKGIGKRNKALAVDYFEFNSSYPKVLSAKKLRLIDKLLYRFALKRLRRDIKTNIYDRAARDEKALFKSLDEAFLQHPDISMIIVTGPPFSLGVHVSQYAKEKKVPYILDLRDPWTWEDKGFGYKGLDEQRFQEAEQEERKAVGGAILVLVPAEDMMETVKKKYPEYASKVQVLGHGFDENDFKEISIRKNRNSVPERWIYFGTLYDGCNREMEALAAYIEQHSNVHWDIYTDRNKYTTYFRNCEGRVVFHPRISAEEAMKKTSEADAFIFVLPAFSKDQFVTKYFEIVRCGCPILLLSPQGKVSAFTEENQLGKWVESGREKEQLAKVLEQPLPINLDFDVSRWSYKALTQQLGQLIENAL